jgi:eukaryotic-like serine/threonine-protein kinase
MPSFWGELKKRNVVKVAVAYAVIAWLLMQVVATVFPALNLPEWGVTMVIVLLFIGAPVALILAWAYELTPSGVERAAPALSRRQVLIGSASLGVIGLALAAGTYTHFRLRPSVALHFQRLTFRRGMIRTARFMPDHQTVLYGALWDGDDCRVYAVRTASPESAPLDLVPATPLAVAPSGEIAIALGRHFRGVMTYGTLARVPLAGGAPRELMEDVKFADWSPDGTELAVVRRMGNRDRLEYPIGTVLAESLPGSGSMGGFSFPRVSQDGSRVAFFDLAGGMSGSVAIVDRAGGKTTLADGYRQLFGLAWNGNEVWFTAADERPLLRDAIMAVTLDGRTRCVSRLIANGTLHDIAPDGRALLAHTDDRSGIAVRVRDDAGERDLSWLDAPIVVDISANGEMILFNETGVGGGSGSSVYLRRTDGAPAVRLGDGFALALSPDARWALRTLAFGSSRIDLLPTGPGETRSFERPGFSFFQASWLPDGSQVIVSAQEQGRARRLYSLDLESGELQAITPENAAGSWFVSPDGALIAASWEGQITMYPIAGGPALAATHLGTDERLVGWIESGLMVAVDPTGTDLGQIFVEDTASGRRKLWRDIRPLDPAGLMWHGTGLVVSPDGESYAYSWHRALSNLYIVEGLA